MRENVHVYSKKLTRGSCNFTRMDDQRNCSNVQMFKCNETDVCACPKNCTLSQWSSWSPCNGNCDGIGFTKRTRKVIEAEKYNHTCDEDLEEQERLRINYVKQATKKILKEAQLSLEKREKEREKKRKIRNAKIEAAKLERNLKGDGTFPQVTMSALCLCLLLILLSTGQHEDRSEDLGRSAEAVQQSG